MFEGTDSVFNTYSQFPQTFLTNPSKLRIYLCKIRTVITEILIVLTSLKQAIVMLAQLYSLSLAICSMPIILNNY